MKIKVKYIKAVKKIKVQKKNKRPDWTSEQWAQFIGYQWQPTLPDKQKRIGGLNFCFGGYVTLRKNQEILPEMVEGASAMIG